MEIKELEQLVQVEQKIDLVNGEFTPSEACDVINGLIDVKINFHKLNRLQIWESNHNCDTNVLNCRIEALQNEKKLAKAFIDKVRHSGGKLSITGELNISLANDTL